MATKFLPYFNSIRTGYLFHPECIRCPRLANSKRGIHTPTKFLDIFKKQSSGLKTGLKIVAGAIIGYYVLTYSSEERKKVHREKNISSGQIRNSCNFIADVVDAVADAVVQITVQDKTLLQSSVRGGSGFIIKSDGLIITNAHVVINKFGQNVNVTLRNGKVFLGTVTDIDEVADLAMVNISGNNLPVLKFGSENTLRVGEWVIAIGSPLFLSHTVTAGIVSSVHRRAAEIGLPERNINYIQTDTTIAVGNSGGPLVNLNGEVVGVNTMTLSPGISFAVPSEYVTKFVDKCTRKSNADTSRYYIGLSYLSLSPAIMNQILAVVELPQNLRNGVYVWKVKPDSPASVCGLQSGDIIVEVEGDTVYDIRSVLDKVKTKPTVTIKYYRKGTYYKAYLTPRKRF